ncbi:hypothetical protein CHS0354_035300 [Potamilus streckersoni]|uniref:Uracil-DNA glycosylase n=1 Tax=Potamilus streckersoni TaxID=2493646 RepID=A0AAE0VNB5_9BIVA|nr:hypothetical protein CHS0354_035300 [Potamilus streckersoni]
MKYILSLYDPAFADYLAGLAPCEVVLYPYRFSKCGLIKEGSLTACADKIKHFGHRLTVCTDILLHEKDTDEFTRFLQHPVWKTADAVRFLDPGIGIYLQQNFAEKPIQQSLERNSLNLHSVQTYLEIFAPAPEVLVLSSQLPLHVIRTWRAEISAEIELLGAGLQEIFYSARNLLDGDPDTFYSEQHIQSTDRPGSLYSRIIQTPAGTLMFYERLLFIADMAAELEQSGVNRLRFDFYTHQEWQLYLRCRLPDNGIHADSREEWGKTTRAFINTNKTDAQFKRLTNKDLREAGMPNGRVLQYTKPDFICVELFDAVSLPCRIGITTPEGKYLETEWHSLKILQGNETSSPSAGIYIAPWVKYALGGSISVMSNAFESIQSEYADALPPLFEHIRCPEWRSLIARFTDSALPADINRKYVRELSAGFRIFPAETDIFRAFNLTAPSAVRVVILGQDPYHSAGLADGLAFSVRNSSPPPSLRNIFREIEADTGNPVQAADGNLTPWAQQGVFLLNSILTVREGIAASHRHLGWESFTDTIIRILSAQPQKLVFLLWGIFATDKIHLIDTGKHAVVRTSHPSPLSYHRGFKGNGQFRRLSEILSQTGTPIRW